ncbi:MAG TPA: family 20 glycosylhydrolase [Acidimicrobiales bacterium]|nr:family 20 glycosylhydrolase [Acidimicrobiales bacterium]
MPDTSWVPVIPSPVDVGVDVDADAGAGRFVLGPATVLSVAVPALLPVAERLRADLATYAGVTVAAPVVEPVAAPGSVRLEVGAPVGPARPTRGLRADGADLDVERHEVVVTEAGVRVVGVTEEAVFRGGTTLLHLVASGGGPVPCLRLADAPELAWRGLSLDVVRWFVPVAEVERVIDVLALHKLNVLHLHLTDNEGWRLEIEGWPSLTAGNDGAYTQDELRHLVRYAAERFVTVVPEVDLPGHTAAVLAAHPELGVVRPVERDVPLQVAHLDPDRPEVWAFVEDVLGQLAALSPSPFLHLGGDEAFGMDPAAYTRFVDQAIGVARELGKRVVGWQETCRAGVGPGEVVQHWIDLEALAGGGGGGGGLPPEVMDLLAAHFGEALGDLDRIADKGAQLLLSPTTTFYLDQPHGDPSVDPVQDAERSRLGLPFYGPRTLEQLLDRDLAAALGAVPPERLVGVEAALWCETVESADDLELLLLPRLAGVAELGWNPSTPAPWADHRRRLAALAPLWDRARWSWWRSASVDWPPR